MEGTGKRHYLGNRMIFSMLDNSQKAELLNLVDEEVQEIHRNTSLWPNLKDWIPPINTGLVGKSFFAKISYPRLEKIKERSDLLTSSHQTSLGTASWSCEGASPSSQSHIRQTLSSEAKGWEIAGIIFLLNSSIHQSKPIFVVLYFWQAPYINKGKHLPAAWTHLWSALVLSLKYSVLS